MALHELVVPAFLVLAFAAGSFSEAEAGTGATPTPAKSTGRTVLDFKVRGIDGKEVALSRYRGKVLLIVNTASKCGFTPQYADLEALYQRYHAKGFEVLAFPANNFMNQEPGNDAEIEKFCTLKYDTTFPLFSKVSVKGKDVHPLYDYLTHESALPGDVRWNFAKFLVGPDGKVVARFDSKVEPVSPEITGAIESLLATK